MAQKPEIQYVGQFYVHGSEAKKLARKTEQKKAKTELPLHRFERIRKVHVDVLAISSILIAAVLMVTMVMGTLSLQSSWQELRIAQEYVYELESANATLAAQYRSGYDLDEVRSAAIALGMIPVEEAQVVSLRVTVPEVQPEPTLLEDVVWFLEGLFA
jgi:hypothetical protein